MTAPTLAIYPFSDEFLAGPYAHHNDLREAGSVVWLESVGCYAMTVPLT